MDPLYLDHAATSPLRPEVREAMAPFLDARFGNASSRHRWGREAAAALEDARADVAEVLGVRPSEILFVRGGTESDNLALVGAWRAGRSRSAPPRLVTTAVEHSAVLEAARWLREAEGAEVRELDVSPDGRLDLDALEEALDGTPALLSIMSVNNETGLRLPVAEAAALARARGALVHTDAAQAVGKIPLSIAEASVDLLTATGHKINGPKGTGILFVREGTVLEPLLHGGGQERGLRPGTEDVAGAVGFACALRLAVAEQAESARRLETIRSSFGRAIRDAIPGARVNGSGGPRAPHVSSLGLPVEDGAALLMALDLEGVAVSGGSACHSGAESSSHVIAALYGPDDPMATVRFSFGLGTTEEDALAAVAVTREVVGRFSPRAARAAP